MCQLGVKPCLYVGTGVILGFLLGGVILRHPPCGDRGNAGLSSETRVLLRKIRGDWGHFHLEARRSAAAALAEREKAEAWTVLLLLDQTSRFAPELLGERYPMGFLNFVGRIDFDDSLLFADHDRRVVLSLLEGIPSNASSAVLWAVTCCLKEEMAGRYGYVDILGGQVDAATPEIRQVARQALRRNTGEDWGYDIVKWRQAIERKHAPRRREAVADSPAARPQ